MLTITNKQMEVFSSYMMDSFIKRTKNHLRQKFPLSTKLLKDEDLKDLILKSIDKAATYNIIERKDVMFFSEFMLCLGENFDLEQFNNWALDILNDNLEGSYKIELLFSAKPLYPERLYG